MQLNTWLKDLEKYGMKFCIDKTRTSMSIHTFINKIGAS